MANICRGLCKKIFFSPVLKSPTHIGFIDVKKNGSKISHLGTFKESEIDQLDEILQPRYTVEFVVISRVEVFFPIPPRFKKNDHSFL
jgi:hypothetical protein